MIKYQCGNNSESARPKRAARAAAVGLRVACLLLTGLVPATAWGAPRQEPPARDAARPTPVTRQDDEADRLINELLRQHKAGERELGYAQAYEAFKLRFEQFAAGHHGTEAEVRALHTTATH